MPDSTVGIDISKTHLDAYMAPAGKAARFTNDAAGFNALIAWVDQPVRSVVYEPTGPWHRAFEEALLRAGLPLARANPLQARRFAQAMGQRAKTDAVDARVLAQMGTALPLRPTEASSPTRRALEELQMARDADRETTAVGADPRGHPYRADDSPALPAAGAPAQGSRGDGAGLRGQGGLRHADHARPVGPPGHRRGAAAHLRLGAEERGAERVGLLASLRRVRRHAVAPARARSADREHPPATGWWATSPATRRPSRPARSRPRRKRRPRRPSASGDGQRRVSNDRRSSSASTGRRP